MHRNVAIIGAGVSGLTCGVVFAERGFRVRIFAEDIGNRTTSAAAGAIWYPYDAEPADAVIAWSLTTFQRLRGLTSDSSSGVSMIELRQFSRFGDCAIPQWANSLGARAIVPDNETFQSGFAIDVPLTDTTIYVDYLVTRFRESGGAIAAGVHFDTLTDVPNEFQLLVNCAGIGARELVRDAALEPHRGQLVLVSKFELPCAVVCDDPPLMYAIPRANDCVFGGTNELSDDLAPDPAQTTAIVAECTRALGIADPPVIAARVGIRPFRRSGVRVEAERLSDGRTVIHNYGHGGSGFTLSWGCAEEVARLA